MIAAGWLVEGNPAMADKPTPTEQPNTSEPDPQQKKPDMEQVQEDAAHERETERGYQ